MLMMMTMTATTSITTEAAVIICTVSDALAIGLLQTVGQCTVGRYPCFKNEPLDWINTAEKIIVTENKTQKVAQSESLLLKRQRQFRLSLGGVVVLR